jgi:YidC/Oxa1 family membrane protein insertase
VALEAPGPIAKQTLGLYAHLKLPELAANVAADPAHPSDKALKTLDFRLYLGPIDNHIFEQPQYANLHYDKLTPPAGCAWCTFDWLTIFIVKLLDWMYRGLRNYGVAIMILVLVVRIILHPITKKSQVSMMKMGKMAPKMEEIKKKYAGNPDEIKRRTMELQREMGLTPLLGCLPMALQMPIWAALYTAVNVNVAIRHQGLFPASWHWLTDLSAPDRLIPLTWFGLTEPIRIPWIGSVIGDIDAINLLPILLTVAIYLQTKLTPQTAPATNPQVAQQQKMMLIMMPVMMLLFLFTAPSGLNLYIMASTFGGVIESYFIRKHIREHEAREAAGTVSVTSKIAARVGPKKPKPKLPRRYF